VRPVHDSHLPTLADAFDREGLSAGFAQIWRRAVGASVRIGLGARMYTRYTPGIGCVATYALTSEDADGDPASIGVVEIEPAGTTHRRFVDDPSMPGLATAADGQAMRRRLPAALDRSSHVLGCGASPVRYKPGTSCVIRYALPTQGDVISAFGKVFAGNLERHAATLSALAQNSAERTDVPRVQGPLAVWPDLGLVVQPAAAGRDLTSVAMDRSAPAAARTDRMRAAGRGLAAFHTAVTTPGPVRAWEEDLEELASYRPLFAELTPDLVRPTDDLLRRFRAAMRPVPEPARAASHGAFRTDQVIVDGDGGLVLLDLDGFCWADPARDLANALSYLEWRAIREPDDAVLADAASRALLDGYATLASVPDDRRLRAYRAATMLKIAGRRLRRLAFDEWPALPELVDRARGVISRER
jgi:hypothetical protein